MMNLVRRYTLSLALVTLLGSTAAVASASTIHGSFALPEKAYWGDKLLPPGEYQFSVNREITGVNLIMLHGENFNAIVMAPAGSLDESKRNCLKLEEVNGTYVVREMLSSVPGNSFRFAVPKIVRDRTESARSSLTVPISAAGF
jgi:hypothetical protein